MSTAYYPKSKDNNNRIALISLGASLDEVDALLAKEALTWARRRLIGVRAIIFGLSFESAARVVNTSAASISRWYHQVNGGGYAALLRHARYRQSVSINKAAEMRGDIETALASEKRLWVRKRLLAVRAVLDGKNSTTAIRIAGVSEAGLCKWLRQVREGGCQALVRDGRAGRSTQPSMPTAVQEIDARLRNPLAFALRQKLCALRLAASGKVAEAAAGAQVSRQTIWKWLKELRGEGLDVWLCKHGKPARHFSADLAQLHAMANAEKNLNVRKRILAAAYVASGVPVAEAAAAANLTPTTVYGLIRRFREEGVAAFRNKPVRGPAVRVSSEQLNIIADILRQDAGISPDALSSRVLGELGVRYTTAGLLNMLKNQLGIRYDSEGRWFLPSTLAEKVS